MDESRKESSVASQQSGQVTKPLSIVIPDSVSNRFSNFTLVQRDAEMFTVSFFEVQRPLLLGSEEEAKNALEKLPSIPAVCVARIIMTPSHFKKVIEAMQANYSKYEQAMAS